MLGEAGASNRPLKGGKYTAFEGGIRGNVRERESGLYTYIARERESGLYTYSERVRTIYI
jgi:hypothetical protein